MICDNFLKDANGKWCVGGKGNYAKDFFKAIERYENIEYCGYVSASDFLKKSSVMLHFSEFEALSNAVLEGMAAGLPVIVNDYEPLKIGPAIVVKDKRELEECLWRLYENPALRRKIGLMGRRYVEKNHSVRVIGERYRKVLENILEG